MCFHKWTKWKEYTLRYLRYYIKGTNLTREENEVRQKRYCTKCGKVQDEYVR